MIWYKIKLTSLSQRAKKLTASHLSILVGLTIFWREKNHLLENSNHFFMKLMEE